MAAALFEGPHVNVISDDEDDVMPWGWQDPAFDIDEGLWGSFSDCEVVIAYDS